MIDDIKRAAIDGLNWLRRTTDTGHGKAVHRIVVASALGATWGVYRAGTGRTLWYGWSALWRETLYHAAVAGACALGAHLVIDYNNRQAAAGT